MKLLFEKFAEFGKISMEQNVPVGFTTSTDGNFYVIFSLKETRKRFNKEDWQFLVDYILNFQTT